MRRPRHSFRREVLALHRQIFARNQAIINRSVYGYTEAFRQYEKEYTRHVTAYRCRRKFDALDRAAARANMLYVGDYHTLPQAQRAFLRLLRRLPPERPVTVALEFVLGKYQAVLDAYVAGRIGEQAFLDGIEHERHWVFGGWQSFKAILDLARERGYSVIGIDTLGRGPAGASLRARDTYAARRINRARKQRPDDLIAVLIGELHISPDHLPKEVARLSPASLPAPRDLIVYQNSDKIYWLLEQKGLEHRAELVELTPNQFCIINTPPIVCQQSFLTWLHADGDEELADQLEAPAENFKDLARLIATFFDLPVPAALDEVEVATVLNLGFLQRLKRRGDFSASDLNQIRQQILRSESYTIPRGNTVYLGNLSVNHASEEATHFLRHNWVKTGEPRLLVDAFYARVLEEAIGFLGSKVINHKRKCVRPAQFEKIARSRNASLEDRRLARLVLKHERIMAGRRVRNASEVYECDAAAFNALSHSIGYQLGERIYYGLIAGLVSKQDARDLLVDSFDDEGEALGTYLYWATQTATVRLPDRL